MERRTEPPSTYAEAMLYTEVTDVPVDGQWTDPNTRVLYCDTEKTWTKHVRYASGWACGCGEFVGEIEKATP